MELTKRPKMFNSKIAHVLWVLLPIVTLGFCGAVPFVVAAVKGVVRPWVAVLYVALDLAVSIPYMVASPHSALENTFIPIAILFIIVSATHTGLLDTRRG